MTIVSGRLKKELEDQKIIPANQTEFRNDMGAISREEIDEI